MKSVVFVAILLLCGAALVRSDRAEMREQWQKSLQECKVEEGASDDDLIPFAKHSKLETYKSKCLLACVNEKSGFTPKDGSVNIERIKEMAKQYYTDASLATVWIESSVTCASKVQTTDRCERANDYVLCIAGEIINKGLDPRAFFD